MSIYSNEHGSECECFTCSNDRKHEELKELLAKLVSNSEETNSELSRANRLLEDIYYTLKAIIDKL